jgi:hypothetical protein
VNCELLGHRARLEDRVRAQGNVVLEVSHAVGSTEHSRARDRGSHGTSRTICVVEAREDLLHLTRGIRRRDDFLGEGDVGNEENSQRVLNPVQVVLLTRRITISDFESS